MTGATGNIYCGLHEYADMSFLLHLLRPGDLFLDVGANIGSYTILASKVCGANTIAIEPDPETAAFLLRNIRANEIAEIVGVEQTAVGATSGSITFSSGRDTTNQVVHDHEAGAKQTVKLSKIDDLVGDRSPIFIKIDVEGYEPEALKGGLQVLAKPELLAIEIETVDEQVLDHLHQNGFSQHSYDPVLRRLIHPNAGTSNNALFVRDASAVEQRVGSAPIRHYRGRQL